MWVCTQEHDSAKWVMSCQKLTQTHDEWVSVRSDLTQVLLTDSLLADNLKAIHYLYTKSLFIHIVNVWLSDLIFDFNIKIKSESLLNNLKIFIILNFFLFWFIFWLYLTLRSEWWERNLLYQLWFNEFISLFTVRRCFVISFNVVIWDD